MAGYSRHIVEQGRGMQALLGIFTARRSAAAAVTPGPLIASTAPAPSAALRNDFVRFAGGDPSSYRGRVPPHLFPQWCLPAMLEVAKTLPYPAHKVINAGCRLRVISPLVAGESLAIKSQLVRVDDNGRRAIVTIRVSTGCASAPRALEADLNVYIPLGKSGASSSAAEPKPKKTPKPTVPAAARELLYARLPRTAGRDFALLTGDFNPIHWLSPYAKAAGFRRVILHGFGSFARSFEGIVRAQLCGDAERLTELKADFVRPLLLPASVGLYVGDEPPGPGESRPVFLGDAPGGAAYLVGHYALRAG